MTKEEKEQLLENDLFMDKEQFKELYHDVYTNKMNNAYLEHELELYKKAFEIACSYCSGAYSDELVYLWSLKEAKEEIEK